jgi:hypothetical protein
LTAQHKFIHQPGKWLGEGVISFSEASDRLKFVTRWVVHPEERGAITAVQSIEVDGVAEQMENDFTFGDLVDEKFSVELDNQLLGRIFGSGLIDGKVMAWEFRANDQQGVEGFEIYELQDDETYSIRAEYVSSDQFRTIIEGKIWAAT